MALFSAASQEILRPTIDPTADDPKGFMANALQLGNLTIRSVLESGARNHPDRPFVLFPETGDQCTWAEIAVAARSTAARLTALGLAPGETVGVLADNSRTTLELFLGSMFGGFITTIFNPLAGQAQLDYVVDHSEVRVLFVSQDYLELGRNAVTTCSRTVTLIPNDPPDWPVEASEQTLHMPRPDDAALLIYTSGTTSKPKAVETSHLSLTIAALTASIELELSSQCKMLLVLPLFHCTALSILYPTFLRSGCCTLHASFEPMQIANSLEHEKIETSVLLPMMWNALMATEGFNQRDLKHFKLAIYGMAPMSEQNRQQIREAFGCKVHLGSGQTEFSPVSTLFKDRCETEFDEGNYWGVPLCFNEQAVIDENGNEVPQGETGEIVVCGPKRDLGILADYPQVRYVVFEIPPDQVFPISQNCQLSRMCKLCKAVIKFY